MDMDVKKKKIGHERVLRQIYALLIYNHIGYVM